MLIVDLDRIEDAVTAIMVTVKEGTRETAGAALRATQRNLTARGPKRTGRFRGSVIPYRGAPTEPPPPEDQAFFPIRGDNEVDALMQGWEPGEEVGTASELDYSNRLAHGYSKQAPDGWVDVAVMDAVSEVEGRQLEANR